MTSIHRPDSKVVRHRKQMRAAGLRPVQFWVPDTRTPEFAAEIRSQCRALKSEQAEADVLRFTEKAITYIEGWK
ncbi:antitoxin MazE family protein [Xylella fastidiosa]|uniref:Antitoxin MazE family protein n=2 Tax=Xylella fastidiosa TaxID=2371 RepID=A0AAW6HUM7_XYLFS|nr:antitoxin MazE family protein [Xylella fastidiosa]MBS9446317.1 antitoxin MazE family protein [Xylella fastidiosa subsp. multiplex]MBS9448321.1 antitoxin MazE family protein [Xylella fastidiosa subsp. multiplex]MBS9450353.1 antitoxin MazE family protein [Xylella fastidiosa subsp. multiplex]MBS9452366.1 antitoxin MazE family protein [Xylella fastidiosa subsp. multiplex]MBS9486680.1 antitoxin MazE family protein [Xylella fastidiosa subsp. multiplex]